MVHVDGRRRRKLSHKDGDAAGGGGGAAQAPREAADSARLADHLQVFVWGCVGVPSLRDPGFLYRHPRPSGDVF